MAIIRPFKAVRPAKDKVAFVTSRSYDDYTEDELNSILKLNPFSFLHIISPGVKLHKEVYGFERFNIVRNRYLEFLEGNTLTKDPKESFYIYKTKEGNNSCCGLLCTTSITDYNTNLIKKHEDTLRHREAVFANYLKTVGFNAEPVLMTYPDNKNISSLIKKEIKKEPEYFFTSLDKITHSLWVINDKSAIKSLREEFKKINSLYIADGHHRSASSNLFAKSVAQDNKEHTAEESYNYFMSYLIPESEIQIYEFNRMITDLNGLTKEEFLIRLDSYFRIENRNNILYKPSKKHHFSMYLDGEFYSLYLRKNRYKFTDALSKLDTQILFKTILEPILGLYDLRNDKRIEYSHGKHNSITIKSEVDNGNFKIGFGMLPITISEIKTIADAKLVMPPKSTYIEPKLRSGLTIYEL